MDSKWIALGLFGLVSFQMGADPQGTQEGIRGAFTSFNGAAKQVPILLNTDGMGSGGAPPAAEPGPGAQTVTLADGRTVSLPAGYRVVPTGP